MGDEKKKTEDELWYESLGVAEKKYLDQYEESAKILEETLLLAKVWSKDDPRYKEFQAYKPKQQVFIEAYDFKNKVRMEKLYDISGAEYRKDLALLSACIEINPINEAIEKADRILANDKLKPEQLKRAQEFKDKLVAGKKFMKKEMFNIGVDEKANEEAQKRGHDELKRIAARVDGRSYFLAEWVRKDDLIKRVPPKKEEPKKELPQFTTPPVIKKEGGNDGEESPPLDLPDDTLSAVEQIKTNLAFGTLGMAAEKTEAASAGLTQKLAFADVESILTMGGPSGLPGLKAKPKAPGPVKKVATV